jgi:hypothetical protein
MVTHFYNNSTGQYNGGELWTDSVSVTINTCFRVLTSPYLIECAR